MAFPSALRAPGRSSSGLALSRSVPLRGDFGPLRGPHPPSVLTRLAPLARSLRPPRLCRIEKCLALLRSCKCTGERSVTPRLPSGSSPVHPPGHAVHHVCVRHVSHARTLRPHLPILSTLPPLEKKGERPVTPRLPSGSSPVHPPGHAIHHVCVRHVSHAKTLRPHLPHPVDPASSGESCPRQCPRPHHPLRQAQLPLRCRSGALHDSPRSHTFWSHARENLHGSEGSAIRAAIHQELGGRRLRASEGRRPDNSTSLRSPEAPCYLALSLRSPESRPPRAGRIERHLAFSSVLRL